VQKVHGHSLKGTDLYDPEDQKHRGSKWYVDSLIVFFLFGVQKRLSGVLAKSPKVFHLGKKQHHVTISCLSLPFE